MTVAKRQKAKRLLVRARYWFRSYDWDGEWQGSAPVRAFREEGGQTAHEVTWYASTGGRGNLPTLVTKVLTRTRNLR